MSDFSSSPTPAPKRQRRRNIASLKSQIDANHEHMVVSTSRWGTDHLAAFHIKPNLTANNLLATLSPNVTEQINAAVNDMDQIMKSLDEMLPNLRAYHDTDIRRTCSNNGYGEFSSFIASLAEISRCHYEDEEQSDGLGGESVTGSMGRGARRSTRREVVYREPSDDGEVPSSQESSHSLTDPSLLKKRSHREVLTAKLASEFLGLVCWRWHDMFDDIEECNARFNFSYVSYPTRTI